MGNRYKYKPAHVGYNSAVEHSCDYCSTIFWESKESSDRKEMHFCSKDCYSKFRSEKLPMEKQHAYKGIRKPGETKQIYHRNYCKTHHENVAHLKSRRYARERNAEGNHTLGEWQTLKQIHENKCAICDKEKKLTKDHIIPLSKGGTDYISNIQPLCQSCNSKKHNHIHENPELLK